MTTESFKMCFYPIHIKITPPVLHVFSPAVGITWGKVVSMYAVAGALAVDCVRHGHPTTVHILVDSLGQFVRKFLVPWLRRRGGWVRLTKTHNAQVESEVSAS